MISPMTSKKFEILVLNQISQAGLKRLPEKGYKVSRDAAHPDAILVRSHDMNAMKVPECVRAIGRAGAGTNNIPVKAMSERGVPVFNAPGANANAVKELVLAGMLMAARNLVPAVRFVGSLNCDDDTLSKRVEAEKKQFAGIELPRQTLGVIGLGKIGSLIVDARAIAAALASRKLKYYVTDFPAQPLCENPAVIALPHLGASTREAEENSAVMVVDQVRDYLEHGNIQNAVNFPDVVMGRESPYRIAIANANVPNMVGQISSAMAGAGLNIHNMVNRSKGEMAYTLVDVDSPVNKGLVEGLARIKGVLAVRYLPRS